MTNTQHTDSEPVEFRTTLDLLGYRPGEYVQICTQRPEGVFESRVIGSDTDPVLRRDRNVWFSVNPTAGPARDKAGRGGVADVTRWAAIYADLDVKPNCCPDLTTAAAIINDLSELLGSKPAIVILSGHGMQPIWLIDDGDIGDDLPRVTAMALLRRWGRLVAHIAELRGARVDSVFELARILRMPGTLNWKYPDTPVGVVTVFPGGGPIDVDHLDDVLTEMNIGQIADDTTDPGVTVSSPADWAHADKTCPYATKMIASWTTDKITGSRHNWLTYCATRLALAHRNGCLTAASHTEGVRTLTARFNALFTGAQGDRRIDRGEIAGALAWGVERASTKSDDAVIAELGKKPHRHNKPRTRPADHATNGTPRESMFDDFDPPADHTTNGHSNGHAEPPPPGGRTVTVTWADTIKPAPVVWAWEEDGHKRIPAGSLVTCAGREGTGKSSFGILLAAQVTRGVLPGSFYGTPKRVLYAALEDSWKYTLVPRFIAAGADLSMIGRVDVTTEENAVGALSLPSDIVALERTVTANDVAMIVVDPLMSVLAASIDTYKAHDVRSGLEPLVAMADRTSAFVVGIAHFNKGKGADVASLITGSGAFKDVPRAVFGFAKDDDGTRIMSQVKNSLGIDELPSLAYRINQVTVPTDTGPAETGLFVFTGESDRSVMDILRGDPSDSEDSQVSNWIKEYLRSRGGFAPATAVYLAGQDQGYNDEQLKKARYRAKAPKIKSAKTGFAGAWIWSIPYTP